MSGELLHRLPNVRGQYRENADLKKTNWFGVGGPAEVLFKPADVQDLADFMRGCPLEVPITVIGVGSNLIVRDGGIRGVVVRLGRGFTSIFRGGAESLGSRAAHAGPPPSPPSLRALAVASDKGFDVEGDVIEAGAAAMDVHVARFAAEEGCAGLEFLSGIPGTIGGALAMNGGAYGTEMQDVLIEAELVLRSGEMVRMTPEQLHYTYRHALFPAGSIFTRCWMRTTRGEPEVILARMEEITAKREATQPIRERTGGSTFKNPDSPPPNLPPQAGGGMIMKAWQLIDAAGCRGLRVGGAQMSELHCNFMINTGEATASDLEALGEEVRARVLAKTGVQLEWEIKRIGVV